MNDKVNQPTSSFAPTLRDKWIEDMFTGAPADSLAAALASNVANSLFGDLQIIEESNKGGYFSLID